MQTGTLRLPVVLETQLQELEKRNGHTPNLLTAKPANTWMDEAALRPTPKMLFGELWYENEVCVLFSDSNLGKSIFAVQMAEQISRGESWGYFTIETPPQTVLYCDFELSDKQFELRYSVKNEQSGYCENHYRFSEKFIRAEINPQSELPARFENFEDFLAHSLELAIVEHQIQVVIVDNITYLRDETEKSSKAISLMKFLQTTAARLGVSLLALAHTPKRDPTKPLSKNDLGGSRMVYNFCDSCFAIGESQQDLSLRYLKQIKVRNGAFRYHEENIVICQINKPENFTGFELTGTGFELEHLKRLNKGERSDLESRVHGLSGQGYSFREIARMVGGISHMTVKRWLEKTQA